MVYSTRSMARAAYRKAKKVERELAPEAKSYRIATIPVVMSNLGVVYDLIGNGSGYGGIVNGTNNGDRVGDRIKLLRLVFRGIIQKPVLNPISSVRVIVFKGTADNGGYVTSDILESLSVYSGKNEEKRYNTKFLFDEVFVLDDAKQGYVEFDWNIKLGWETQFTPGAALVEDGGLYMLLLTTSATNQPSWDGVFRISYTDS